MHILLIHQIFVTPDEGGGTRHYEMCKYLVKQGHKVSVIASDIHYLSGNKRKIESEVKDGIKIYYAQTNSDVHKSIIHRALNFFSFSFYAYKRGKQLKNINLIWGTTPPLFQAYASSLLAKKKKVPYLLEIRDLWLDFALQLGIIKNPIIFRFFKLIEKITYKSATHVIVNSPGFVKHIKTTVPGKEIDVFPNGVDTSDFSVISDKKIEKFKSKHNLKNKFIVMYTGNIGVANDIENILAAARLLDKSYSDIKIVFVGGGLNTSKYKKLIAEENLVNVIFIESQPKKEIPNILAAADVCLATLKAIPLFNTNYPNKVFDYMAAGKPTILAIDGAMREVIEKANGGIFVQAGNSEQLKESILYYYHNKEKILEHGKNAQKFVVENFDRKEITSKFGKYLELIMTNEQKIV